MNPAGNVEVSRKGGILISSDGREIVLDPTRRGSHGVVSHGHMDHMLPGSLMTHETRDIMEVRMGTGEAETMGLGERCHFRGFDVEMVPAGHVLGSAMILLDDGRVLYTGDFDPEGGFLSPPAKPVDASVLIMETTYGDPSFVFPSKSNVLEDLASWMAVVSEEGPVVVGAYEMGKSQEVLNIGRRLGLRMFSTAKTCAITGVYNRYGADIEVLPLDTVEEEVGWGPGDLLVVPPRMLKPGVSPVVDRARENGGQAAFVSGWCAKYSYFRSHGLHAQFPLSDHADYNHLLKFVEKVDPDVVYLVHGNRATREAFAGVIRENMEKRVFVL
ncbi:MAG: hypothetical protein J7L61_01430 [Thermoplasmata archaeon]|nr:hypothetical protein [Thermoplasmata archaeon]